MNFFNMLEGCKLQGQTLILNRITKAQPFIFEPFKASTGESMLIDSKDNNADIPFKVCSFELSGNMEMYYRNPTNGNEASISCIVAEEIEPQKVIYYAMGIFDNSGLTEIRWFHHDDHGLGWWNILNKSVTGFLAQLQKGQHGHTSPRTVFKWKHNGEKLQSRINKVIHVRNVESVESETTRNVIWSHAFWVMGHWRNINGIGKNRDGIYGVSGKTWVNSYVKNDELGNPITKIRFNKVNNETVTT